MEYPIHQPRAVCHFGRSPSLHFKEAHNETDINSLLWEDINLEGRYVILYTRKKKGGHRTPRKVPMTKTLYDVLRQRYENRDPDKPWVFGIDTGAVKRTSSVKEYMATGKK